MRHSLKHRWRDLVLDNLSYKLVALLIALILWVVILGRRDFTVSKSYELEVNAGPGRAVATQSVDSIKVKVSGPRTALRKFLEGGAGQIIFLDASKKSLGETELSIPLDRIEVPFGVKVVSVRPGSIKAKIISQGQDQ